MSYYDSDSEDEYYGYYGKNNHRKPQPNPAPPQPDPPAHTSCRYEDSVRRYDGGQGSYGNEHDTYLDHAEPDHCSHEHDDHRFEHKAPKCEIAGEIHGQREVEYEVHEHEELEYEGGQVYEPEGLEYEDDERYEPEYEGDEEELEEQLML
jgi:hypothetical protein